MSIRLGSTTLNKIYLGNLAVNKVYLGSSLIFPNAVAGEDIEFVASASGTNSATLPTHQAGDLFICFMFRDGSNSQPGAISGWSADVEGIAGDSSSFRVQYLICDSAAETNPTSANATTMLIHQYRPAAGKTLSIGDSNVASGTGTTVSYPTLSLLTTDGSSWVGAFGAHRSANTAIENAPSGMINRSDAVDATDEVAGHDTDGGVSSWSNQDVIVGGTSSQWRGVTYEIRVS